MRDVMQRDVVRRAAHAGRRRFGPVPPAQRACGNAHELPTGNLPTGTLKDQSAGHAACGPANT